jgi:hypothetical protein
MLSESEKTCLAASGAIARMQCMLCHSGVCLAYFMAYVMCAFIASRSTGWVDVLKLDNGLGANSNFTTSV